MKMFTLIQLISLILSYLFYITSVNGNESVPWQLPVLPVNPPQSNSYYSKNTTHEKLIPRHLWIALREANETLNFQLPALFARNPLWEVHLCGNYEKDVFMNNTFRNTSLLWAYHIISPELGAAKADIWRYAVLWMYGGAYIDDDSDMKVPLDNVVGNSDEMVISFERNGYNGDNCFIPRFHLSDISTFHLNASLKDLNIFQGNIIPNWAIISAPRHIILKRTMENIVEIIRQEYIRDTVLRHLKAAHRWQLVMCATGPSVLTGSAREVVIDITLHGMTNTTGPCSYKLADVDFRDYGGRFKAISKKISNDQTHFMYVMEKQLRKGKHIGLLREYLYDDVDVNSIPPDKLKSWENEVIQSQNGKQIFVVREGKKRGIQNYESFLALNYTMADVIVVSDEQISSIPNGEPMPYLTYPPWH